MADKRQKRKNCRVFMKVVNNETDQVMGHMVNLTTEGLMLTGENEIGTGITFQLKVVLPAEVKGVRELLLTAVSRWCDPDEDTPQFYNTGLKVAEVSRPEVKIIKQLMKKYCF